MTVRPIDRFIGAMHRSYAEELVIDTGKPVRIRTGSIERVLLAQHIRKDQVESLLREVLPADRRKAFEEEGEIAWPYASPSGPVMIRAHRRGGRLSASVTQYAQPSKQAAVPRAPVKAEPIAVGDAVGAGSLVLESPLDTVMSTAPESPRLATGVPITEVLRNRPPAAPGGATPVKAAGFQVIRGSGSGSAADNDPVVVDIGSDAPPPLPVEYLTKLPTHPPVAEPEQKAVRHYPVVIRSKIDAVLHALVSHNGSDLHLTAGIAPRMRKDGDIRSIPGFEDVLDSDTIKSWLMEIAPESCRKQFEATADTDYAYEIQNVSRFRVNAFRDRRGVGGVLRTIPTEIMTADQLKLPPVVRDFCDLEKGLVVVTGPTGSGKSTTLASMIDLINRKRADHVITIEDPVEFVHEPKKCLINQREIHSHTESFSSALRAALREDPDIVLVGEMRDLETVSIAIETAETGHLVFGTLHTNTAVSTVDRIIDQFPPDRQSQIRVMLSETLRGVVAQTLCKKIGGGRVAAYEILIVQPAVANLIREGKTFQIPSLMQTGKGAGMQLLNDSLLQLFRDGKIEPREAYRRSVQRAEMRAMLEKFGYVYSING